MKRSDPGETPPAGPGGHGPPAPLELELLGPWSARLQGRPLPALRSRRGQWLLALLVLHRGRRVDRDWLAGLLWPESTESQSLFNLRRAVSDLRRALGPEAGRLQSPTPRTLAFSLAGAWIDVQQFDDAIGRGDPASLERAVCLYRGPLLATCPEAWIVPERVVREQAYLGALETLAADAQAAGNPKGAVRYLRLILSVEPLRETAQRALLEALAAVGEDNAALQSYREFRLLLHRELNAAPAPETTALFEQLRARARARPWPEATAPPAAPVDRTPDGELSRPGSLPYPISSFIGREQEGSEVRAGLAAARLITLTGPGGVGKTRLALHVGAQLVSDYPDGAWFVDLAPVVNASLVLQTVAHVLGVSEQPGRPLVETVQAFLRPKRLLLILDNCEHLLDACARLTAALLEGCPHLRVMATSRQSLGLSGEMVWPVSPLTQDEAARLFVERGRAAERAFALTEQNAAAVEAICRRLDGLPLAIELAAARLRALGVEQIARRLDDRFRLLNSGSSTALPRHQTLRATLDWSYDLLSAAEQTLLCRLSVFVGHWTLAAAEAVCSDFGFWILDFGLPAKADKLTPSEPLTLSDPIQNPKSKIQNAEVLDLLTQLVDKSLVMAEGQEGEKRYRLLETVREYAAEQLSDVEGNAWARRHAGYYLALAEQAAPMLSGPEQSVWLGQLGREHENLQSALAWALTAGEEETALRLGAALWRFWWLQGHLREGRDCLAEVLALPDAQAPTAARAQALLGAGRINDGLGDAMAAMSLTAQSLVLWQQVGDQRGLADTLNQLGDLELDRSELHAAQAHYEGAMALYQELQDRSGIAETFYNLALVALRQADVETADALLAECRRLAEELGDRSLLAGALANQGRVVLSRGDVTRGRSLFEEALTLRRELGVSRGIAWSLLDVAQTARLQNDLEAARSAAAEALAICRQLDNWAGIGWALSELADAVYSQGEIEAAAALYEESLAVARKLDNTRGIAGLLTSLGRVALRLGDSTAAHTCFTEALVLQRQLGSLFGEAWALEGLAEVAAAREQLDQATRLLSAAARLWEQLPGRLPSLDQGSTEALLACLRSRLGDEAFAAYWEAGRTPGEGM